jgi:CheY-like chemotaxis protein
MDTDASTLLVVDDSAVKSRDTIATAGKIWGYTVLTAADGQQAQGRIAERLFDLALLDVTL